MFDFVKKIVKKLQSKRGRGKYAQLAGDSGTSIKMNISAPVPGSVSGFNKPAGTPIPESMSLISLNEALRMQVSDRERRARRRRSH